MFDPIKVSIWMFILCCNIIPIVYYSICWRLNIGFPPKLLCWHPIPNVMPLGSGAFGGPLGREGGALGNGISALIKQASESPLSPPPMWGPSQRQLAVNPDAGSHQSPICQGVVGLGLPSLQNREKQISVVDQPLTLWYFATATGPTKAVWLVSSWAMS